MLFASYLGCLQAIARLKYEATVGQVQKMNPHLTVGQVKRILVSLDAEGYVWCEKVAYGGTGKNVYHLSGKCLSNVFSVNDSMKDYYPESEEPAS